MSPRIAAAGVAVALATSSPCCATLAPAELSQAGIDPPAGARLPQGLHFTTDAGAPVTFGPSAAPTVLVFADYTCRHICGAALTLTAAALAETGLRPGRDFRLVVVGADPKDGPADARAFAEPRLAPFPDLARFALVLVGEGDAAGDAMRALGYRVVYDPSTDQFAHDVASFVLTPDGRLSAVASGIGLQPEELLADLIAAAGGAAHEDWLVSRALSVCYGFAAAHGVHSAEIVNALRGGALLFVAGFGAVLWRFARGRRTA